MTKAVLFDLDETLVDRTNTIVRYMCNLYKRYHLPAENRDVFLQRFVELDRFGYAVRAEVFETLIKEFEVTITTDAWLKDFRQYAWSDCQCYPDTYDVLRTLRNRGYKLGIVTNGSSESQRAKIRATNLAELVDVILVSAEEKVTKPDPIIFRRAAELLQVRTANCLFIGDNPDTDIMGALGVGMKVVWIKRHLTWPDTQAQNCRSIAELAELLSLPI